MGILTKGNTTHQEISYQELLEPGLRKVFYETYKEMPEEYSKIFHVKTSNKAIERDFGMGAMKPWTEFSATNKMPSGTAYGAVDMPTIEYQTVPKGNEVVFTHEEFASGIAIERKYMDDEQYGVIKKMTADLARAGRYKVESDASKLLNTAFTAKKENVYEATPVALIGTHTLLGGGTCSNKVQKDLSAESLKEAMVLAKRQKDEAGNLIVLKFDTLVVPPTQEFLAQELLRSTHVTGSNHNDINVLQSKANIVVYDYLTSDTNTFLMDSVNHGLSFYWRVKPEFKREEQFDSLVDKYRGYMRYSYGYSDWRGIIGIGNVADPS